MQARRLRYGRLPLTAAFAAHDRHPVAQASRLHLLERRALIRSRNTSVQKRVRLVQGRARRLTLRGIRGETEQGCSGYGDEEIYLGDFPRAVVGQRVAVPFRKGQIRVLTCAPQ